MDSFDSLVDDSVAKAAPQSTPAPQSQPQAGPPSFDSLQDDNEKYAGAGQTAAAGAEGALKGLLGPAAPVLEKLAGVPYSEQRGRAEAHPVAHGAGEAGGLFGGFLTGTGEAALMGKAGEAAGALTGLNEVAETAPIISKIGSAAVKQAAEMAVLQSTDNISQHIMNDPKAASESAMANVGLAAAIGAGGGAFGAGIVSPLWKATVGPKIEGGLKAIISRLGGVESDALSQIAPVSETLEQQTGVPIPNEIKPVVNGTPGAMEIHSQLNQDDTSIAGRAYQDKVNEYQNNLDAKSIESLGKDPNEIHSLPDLDKYSTGRAQGEALNSELKEIANPTIEGYNEFNEKYKDSTISEETKRAIADQIGQKTIEQGWHKASDPASSELAQKVISDLEKQDSIIDLKKYITNLRNSNPYGKETYAAARDISRILSNSLEDAIADNIVRAGGNSLESQLEVESYGKLRKNYAQLMSHLENLDEHLKVGKWDSPESFFRALQDMSTQRGERVLERLSGKNSANILELLKSTPETLDKVKQYHVDKLLSEAVQKAPPGKAINTRYLVDTVFNPQKMSPQVRDLILSPEQQLTLQGIHNALEALKDPTHNFSNTARTLAKQAHGAVSPISLIAMLMGHGEAGILSWLGSLGLSEVKPALKLGMLKFLSSDVPVKAEGFKSMMNYLDHSYNGGNALTKAAKSVFNPGFQVLNSSQMPSSKDIMKLDKLVADNNKNPNKILESQQNVHVGHYMPEHQEALAQSQGGALQYLQSIKPHPYKPNPLDREIPPTSAQEARYHRALAIAENPLVVLQHAKEGTIQVSDIQDLNAMYPSHTKAMMQSVSDEMISRHADEEPIPYKTRVGVSLLLGQPLDSSMIPSSIVAAQPKPQQPTQQPQGKTKKSTSTLGKNNKMYSTPEQAAEIDKASRD